MLEKLLEHYRVIVVCAGRVLEWGLDGWGIILGWGLNKLLWSIEKVGKEWGV